MAITRFSWYGSSKWLETFRNNHPKLPLFFQAAVQNALMEGSIIQISAKTPEGKAYCTNLKLTAPDAEMLQALKRMKEQESQKLFFFAFFFQGLVIFS